jgi:hypothetical protein
MNPQDPHFEDEYFPALSVIVGSQRPHILDDGFQIDRTLSHVYRRHRVGTGGEGQSIDVGSQRIRRQVQHALTSPNQVLGRLGTSVEAQDRTPTKPECGRHRRQIRRTVLVVGRDEDDGGAEVQDCGLDCGVQGISSGRHGIDVACGAIGALAGIRHHVRPSSAHEV